MIRPQLAREGPVSFHEEVPLSRVASNFDNQLKIQQGLGIGNCKEIQGRNVSPYVDFGTT